MTVYKKIIVSMFITAVSCDVAHSVWFWKKQVPAEVVAPQPSGFAQRESIQIPQSQNFSDNATAHKSLVRWGVFAMIATPTILTGWNLFKLRSMQNEMKELKRKKITPVASLAEQSDQGSQDERYTVYDALVACGLLKTSGESEGREGENDADLFEPQWVSADDMQKRFDQHAQALAGLLGRQEEVEKQLHLLVSRQALNDAVGQLDSEIDEIRKKMLTAQSFELVSDKTDGKYLSLKR